MSLNQLLTNSWRRPNLLTFLLYPFSWIYCLMIRLHRLLYQIGILSTHKVPVPVIVVGNLTVGGSGKTPLVIHLVEALRMAGYSPGVVSRGYAGKADQYPLRVTQVTSVEDSGDEPAMIVQRTGVPMVVGPKRRENIEFLLARENCNIVICDDGLQHWALHQDVKICIIDKTLDEQNQYMLPAGPYRESPGNSARMDIVVEHVRQEIPAGQALQMVLETKPVQPVLSTPHIPEFDYQQSVHAVAGIGKPQRFFDTCRSLGLNLIQHAFPDHHYFSQDDISFDDDLNVLMTEKDAIKCRQIANQKHWFLPVDAKLNQDIAAAITALLD